MNKNESFIGRFIHLPKDIKLLMAATLVTNIGNGMFTIAVSKLVYDKTNSAMAFGGVMILQYIVMFALQFLSGSVVDRNNPKHVSIICDLINGFLVLSSGAVVLFSDMGLPYLFIAIILMNVVNPFFSSASFSLMPSLVKDKSQLLQINSIVATLFQAGQLLGCALVAPIIFFINSPTALIIDGITFLLSATFVGFVKMSDFEIKKESGKNVAASLVDDWKEIAHAMKEEKSFAAHLFMASGDYVSINFFNLMLVPMVTLWYKNNSFCISLFDSGFAIGAMIFVAFVVTLSKKIGLNNSAFIGLFIQSTLFILLIFSRQPIISFMITLAFGAANSFSVAIYNSNLQQRCNGPIKGRVSSMKSLIVSMFSLVFIPIITRLHDISITYGLLASGGIILIYSIISLTLGRRFVFGNSYLVKGINVGKKAEATI